MTQKRGYTVIEVMMSVALLGIGLMALASLQVLGMRGNVGGEDRGMAASILASRLEQFYGMDYTQNPNTGQVTVDIGLKETINNPDPSVEVAGDGSGWTAEKAVNSSGLNKTQFQLLYPDAEILNNDFRYWLSWQIEDQGDQTKPGAWKTISIRVRWVDRSDLKDRQETITIDSVPITAQII